MGNHDDQTVLGNLLEYLHDLNAGLGVKSTGRLIGKDNVGIVDQSSGYSHTLHLTA